MSRCRGVASSVRYGHSGNNCRQIKAVCPRCGTEVDDTHSPETCSRPIRCCHCKAPHYVTSKLCPKYLLEKEVLALKTKEHLTFSEALARASLLYPSGVRTYASSLLHPQDALQSGSVAPSQIRSSDHNVQDHITTHPSPPRLHQYASTRACNNEDFVKPSEVRSPASSLPDVHAASAGDAASTSPQCSSDHVHDTPDIQTLHSTKRPLNRADSPPSDRITADKRLKPCKPTHDFDNVKHPLPNMHVDDGKARRDTRHSLRKLSGTYTRQTGDVLLNNIRRSSKDRRQNHHSNYGKKSPTSKPHKTPPVPARKP